MVDFFEHTSAHILAKKTLNMVITTYMIHKIKESQNKSKSEFEKLDGNILNNSQKKLKVEKEIH